MINIVKAGLNYKNTYLEWCLLVEEVWDHEWAPPTWREAAGWRLGRRLWHPGTELARSPAAATRTPLPARWPVTPWATRASADAASLRRAAAGPTVASGPKRASAAGRSGPGKLRRERRMRQQPEVEGARPTWRTPEEPL